MKQYITDVFLFFKQARALLCGSIFFSVAIVLVGANEEWVRSLQPQNYTGEVVYIMKIVKIPHVSVISVSLGS